MTLQLSAPSEKVVPYEYIGEGRVIDLMPELTKADHYPGGVAVIVDRRQYAPEEVRANYNNTFFWTGDSAGADERGGALLTLDSPLLRQLTPESEKLLVNGALKLEPKQWKELRANKEHSRYLRPQEVEDAQGKGYVLKKGKFVPANKAVAKAWDHLSRGRNLQPYAQMVSEASRGSTEVMQLYFDQLYFDRSKPSTPTLRSLVVSSIDYYSGVYGDNLLGNITGRLVRVAPEAHVAREKADSQRILEQTLAVINNPDLNRDGMVKAVSRLYKC